MEHNHIQKLYLERRPYRLTVCCWLTCYLYSVTGNTGHVSGQQDQYGSSVLLLGLKVFFCGEVNHLHDDTAAGQHRLVRRACLRHHNGPTATWADIKKDKEQKT